MPILSVEVISDDRIPEISLKPRKQINPNSVNYVNNKELYAEFISYYEKKQKWLAKGNTGAPPLSDKIGAAILQIARRRCYSRQFLSYTPDWKEEMVQDAVLAAVANCHNFNPSKSNNPFAYLTTIVTNAVIQRIKIEHKQNYIKLKSYDNSHGFIGFCDENVNEEDIEMIAESDDIYRNRLEKISQFEISNNLIHQDKKPKLKKVDDSVITLFDFEEKSNEENPIITPEIESLMDLDLDIDLEFEGLDNEDSNYN